MASNRELKYLGVMIDGRLNFNSHVGYAREKASKVINALSRSMPHNGDPRSSRRLLASVSSSILWYGVPSCGAELKTKRNRVKLNSAFRLMVMRVASAYRTISSAAICVIAGMIPICFTLEENIECYERMTTSQVRTLVRKSRNRNGESEMNPPAHP